MDIKNGADQMVFQCEKTISEMGDKLTAEEKTGLESKLNALKEAIKSDNIEEIKAKQEDLQKDFYEVSAKLYQQAQQAQQAQQGSQAPGSGGPNADGVYDAEFKDANE